MITEIKTSLPIDLQLYTNRIYMKAQIIYGIVHCQYTTDELLIPIIKLFDFDKNK